MNEEWREIIGFPGYMVSSFGRVSGKRKPILKPWVNAGGYHVHGLSINGKLTFCFINRLVCTAFHGPAPTDSHEAAHWDGNCGNNNKDNLRWATPAENTDDKRRHGTILFGERHFKARLSDAAVLAIRARLASIPRSPTGKLQRGSLKAIAIEFGVSRQSIKHAIHGTSWRHLP